MSWVHNYLTGRIVALGALLLVLAFSFHPLITEDDRINTDGPWELIRVMLGLAPDKAPDCKRFVDFQTRNQWRAEKEKFADYAEALESLEFEHEGVAALLERKKDLMLRMADGERVGDELGQWRRDFEDLCH